MTAALVVTPKPFSSHLPHPGPQATQTHCSAVPPEHRAKNHCHLAAVGSAALSRQALPAHAGAICPISPLSIGRDSTPLCPPARSTGPAPRCCLPQASAHPFPPPADATDQSFQSPEKVCLNEEEEEEEGETLDGQGGQVSPDPRRLPGKVVHLIADIWIGTKSNQSLLQGEKFQRKLGVLPASAPPQPTLGSLPTALSSTSPWRIQLLTPRRCSLKAHRGDRRSIRTTTGLPWELCETFLILHFPPNQ